jgi:hypothetical protein
LRLIAGVKVLRIFPKRRCHEAGHRKRPIKPPPATLSWLIPSLNLASTFLWTALFEYIQRTFICLSGKNTRREKQSAAIMITAVYHTNTHAAFAVSAPKDTRVMRTKGVAGHPCSPSPTLAWRRDWHEGASDSANNGALIRVDLMPAHQDRCAPLNVFSFSVFSIVFLGEILIFLTCGVCVCKSSGCPARRGPSTRAAAFQVRATQERGISASCRSVFSPFIVFLCIVCAPRAPPRWGLMARGHLLCCVLRWN